MSFVVTGGSFSIQPMNQSISGVCLCQIYIILISDTLDVAGIPKTVACVDRSTLKTGTILQDGMVGHSRGITAIGGLMAV